MMKKFITLTAFGMLAAGVTNAQFQNKVFTIEQGTYQNLTSPTIITTPEWDDFDQPGIKVPLTFSFNIMNKSTDTLVFDDNNYGSELSFYKNDSLTYFGINIDPVDLSSDPAVEFSTIGYKIETVSNKKIAKFQWKDIGVYGMTSGPSIVDTLNYQIWLHENSDVEVRFGPSVVTSPLDEIFETGLPTLFFTKGMDINTSEIEMLYAVTNTTPPTIDSIDVNNPPNEIGVDAYPTNGTIWKFASATVGIKGTELNAYTSIYPNYITDYMTVNITKENFTGVASIIDMSGKVIMNQKVTTGKQTLQLQSLTAGNYMINIKDANRSVFYKFVKN